MAGTDVSKRALRRAVRRRWSTITEDARREASDEVCRRLLPWLPAGPVLLYEALRDEVCLDSLIAARWDQGQPVVLPRVAGSALTLHLVLGPDDLEIGAYGIREPKPALAQVPLSEVAAIVLPARGLARDGARLGRGAGYYDRLLAEASPEIVLIGVVLSWQVYDVLPVDPHDVPVAMVVTERETLRI